MISKPVSSLFIAIVFHMLYLVLPPPSLIENGGFAGWQPELLYREIRSLFQSYKCLTVHGIAFSISSDYESKF